LKEFFSSFKSLLIFHTLQSKVSSKLEYEENFRLLLNKKCSENDNSACVMLKLLSFMDKMLKKPTFSITKRITLLQTRSVWLFSQTVYWFLLHRAFLSTTNKSVNSDVSLTGFFILLFPAIRKTNPMYCSTNSLKPETRNLTTLHCQCWLLTNCGLS
jgi:hypothetical protein